MAARIPRSRPGRSGRLSSDDRLALGVAVRLAHRLGASPAVVRVAFVLLALALGWGIAVYGFMALLLAGRDEPDPRPVTVPHNLGVVLATAAQVLVVEDFVTALPATLLWPVGLALFAVILADPGLEGETVGRPAALGRVVAGVVLMVAGFLSALAGTQDLTSLWLTAAAALVLVGGIALVLAPWLQQIVAGADSDRRERIRAEERADIAAHLHDSVLQTLTLIQNRAGDPQLTAALAHQQERELRRWLYGKPDVTDDAVTFRGAIERASADVEDQYLKIVECIVVGDTELSATVLAAVGAAREAMVNAAKFAGIPMISVFAQVDDETVTVFVRDRGNGFETASVPEDRHGLTDSIRGRVERLGGPRSFAHRSAGGPRFGSRCLDDGRWVGAGGGDRRPCAVSTGCRCRARRSGRGGRRGGRHRIGHRRGSPLPSRCRVARRPSDLGLGGGHRCRARPRAPRGQVPGPFRFGFARRRAGAGARRGPGLCDQTHRRWRAGRCDPAGGAG